MNFMKLCSQAKICSIIIMPLAGLEPARSDGAIVFETIVSTVSTTGAFLILPLEILKYYVTK